MKVFTASFFTIILVTFCSVVCTASKTQELVEQLNQMIEKSVEIDLAKTLRVARLKKKLGSTHDLDQKYELTRVIYKEYEVFNFDSAYHYVSQLESIGKTLNSKEKVREARSSLFFILMSAGMYKEASDVLNILDVTGMSGKDRADYYLMLGRYNLDLATYSTGAAYSSQYSSRGVAFLDSAAQIYERSSFGSLYSQGLKYYILDKPEESKTFLNELYGKRHLTLRQRALVSSTMNAVYSRPSEHERALELLLEAAITDIRASTKEELAMVTLAKIFYDRGDFNNASNWIEKANANAILYGARQRKAQLVPVMQLIQSAKIKSEETRRTDLLRITAVICLVLVGVVVFSLVFYRQVQKLRAIRKELMTVNEKLNLANEKNEIYIERLQKSNKALREAERIKEEYISYFINIDSELFDKVQRLKKAIEKKASESGK